MNSGMSRAGIPFWPTVSAEALISVHGVSKLYRGSSQMLFAPKQWVKAVDDVSFAVERNEILAIIGESGSGKSTLTRMLVGLERPTSGHVEVAGRRLDGDLKYVRRQVQIVFQDPYTSLDPRLPVGESIREPLQALGYEGDLARRVQAVLDAVALPAGAERKFPHEFSAGQLQRVAIARALAPEPRAIVADEPVSALDVSVQAQVLNLLLDLRDRAGLTIVLVAHDLGVVSRVADRVAVMFGGKLVEIGTMHEVVSRPRHPYMRQLLRSVLRMDGVLPEDEPRQEEGPAIDGRSTLCPYRSRCPLRIAQCDEAPPPLRTATGLDAEDSGHLVACHVNGHMNGVHTPKSERINWVRGSR